MMLSKPAKLKVTQNIEHYSNLTSAIMLRLNRKLLLNIEMIHMQSTLPTKKRTPH